MSPVEKQQLKILKQLSVKDQAILEAMVSGKKPSKAIKTDDLWEEQLKVMRKWHRLCQQNGLI